MELDKLLYRKLIDRIVCEYNTDVICISVSLENFDDPDGTAVFRFDKSGAPHLMYAAGKNDSIATEYLSDDERLFAYEIARAAYPMYKTKMRRLKRAGL